MGTGPTPPATTGTAPEIPSIPDPRISVHDVDETKAPKLSGYGVDPTAAYENNPTWKSTLYSGTKVAIDIVKEASDVFIPLKSAAGGLSAVLKYYDVYLHALFLPVSAAHLWISKQWQTARQSNHWYIGWNPLRNRSRNLLLRER